MPRKYTRKTIRKYTDDDVNIALQLILDNKMSLNASAKMYKIPRGTLQNRYHGRFIHKHGGQTVLGEREERELSDKIAVCASWGFPLDKMDIRLIIKSYLCENGKVVTKFKDNMPGVDWVNLFLKRHSNKLSQRTANNIKRARAEVDDIQLKEYHNNLSKAISGLQPHQIFNYDESNLADNPSAKKFIFSRGVKYPDNVANFTKSCVTLMFCVSADGTLLPPHVVYKSTRIYEKWIENGPRGDPCCTKSCCRGGCQFSCTASGWFDQETFEKWFEHSFLPHAKKIDGKKALIGDNLSSHFSARVISLAEENNILFLSLPPNSTHLSQPLDVSFFGPLKKAWSKILFNFKAKNPKTSSVNKILFAPLLKQLLVSEPFRSNIPQNIINGFAATGIYPIEVAPLIKRLTGNKTTVLVSENAQSLDDSLTCYLRKHRFPSSNKGPPSKRGKMINVVAGQPITTTTFDKEGQGPSKVRVESTAPENDLSDSENSTVQDEEIELNENIQAVTEFKKGDFAIIELRGKRTTKRYLAQLITDPYNNECDIQFFVEVKGSNGKKFKISEEPCSFIDTSSIVGSKLTIPILNNRGLYVFPKRIGIY